VIHRDIKPQNILLGKSGEAKVADFGIARAASVTTITQAGSVLGTVHYISPEQARGEPTTPRSDLYSLGVVLYEMLTGELPYKAETPVGVVMKHMNEQLRHPREINPDLPESLNAITVRLLAKNPAERYPGAAEVIDDLQRAKGSLERQVSRGGEWLGSKESGRIVESSEENSEVESLPGEEGLDGVLHDVPEETADGQRGVGGAVASGESPGEPDPGGQLTQDPEENRNVSSPTPLQPRLRDTAGAIGRRLGRLSAGWFVVAAIVLTGIVALALMFSVEGGVAATRPVPLLVGKTWEKAKQLAGDDFEIVGGKDALPDQIVFVQRPPPGKKVEQGSEIYVKVGDCDERCVTVPDLRKQSEAEALEALDGAGLVMGNVDHKPSDDIPKGQIISQNPPPGSRWEEGGPVSVTISTGS
jgi:serine/threonine-protein kinase